MAKGRQTPIKTFFVVTHTTKEDEILHWGFGELLPIDDQNPKLFASRMEAELGIYEAEKKTGLKCEQREVSIEFSTRRNILLPLTTGNM